MAAPRKREAPGERAWRERIKRRGPRHEGCGGALARVRDSDGFYRCAECGGGVHVGTWAGPPIGEKLGER